MRTALALLALALLFGLAVVAVPTASANHCDADTLTCDVVNALNSVCPIARLFGHVCA